MSVNGDSLYKDILKNRLGQGARMYSSVAQTISDTTWETVGFDSESFSEGNSVLTDLTNHEFDIREGGVYIVCGSILWASDAGWTTGDAIRLQLYINASILTDYWLVKTNTGYEAMAFTELVNVSAGDSIHLEVYQNSGVAMDITGNEGQTFMTIARI